MAMHLSKCDLDIVCKNYEGSKFFGRCSKANTRFNVWVFYSHNQYVIVV